MKLHNYLKRKLKFDLDIAFDAGDCLVLHKPVSDELIIEIYQFTDIACQNIQDWMPLHPTRPQNFIG